MERAAILDRLWKKAEALAFIPKEEFVANYNGWEFEPVVIEGELAFVGARKGPEFHFDSFGTGHRLPMSVIRPYLQKIIAQHGCALTKTPKDDTRQHRFNRRFGFVAVGEDEWDVHYRIEKLK